MKPDYMKLARQAIDDAFEVGGWNMDDGNTYVLEPFVAMAIKNAVESKLCTCNTVTIKPIPTGSCYAPFSSKSNDVPTHKEPKKVSVEDELVEVMKSKRFDDYPCHAQAKAAIEFFNNHPEYRKQMGW